MDGSLFHSGNERRPDIEWLAEVEDYSLTPADVVNAAGSVVSATLKIRTRTAEIQWQQGLY